MRNEYEFFLNRLHKYIQRWEKYICELTDRERQYLIVEKEPRCSRKIALRHLGERLTGKTLAKGIALHVTVNSLYGF